jgi:hypothetical protein
MDQKRICINCNGVLTTGRSDKKFCDDHCRNNYNNNLNSDGSAFVRNLNNILRRNRRILIEYLNPTGKAKVSCRKLREKGFDFTYHTHTYVTQKGSVYKFCYEVGYLPIDEENYMIVKRDDPD